MITNIIKKIVTGIDKMSDLMGHIVKYLILVLIFVLCYEVVSRYVFDKPTNYPPVRTRCCMLLCASILHAIEHKVLAF